VCGDKPMNKRQTKKANQKKLHNFIRNINQEELDLREEYYVSAYEELEEADYYMNEDLCFCDKCKLSFPIDVHKLAFIDYECMLEDGRDSTRIINLGRRKIEIHLSTDGKSENHWTLGRDIGGIEDVLAALNDDERRIVLYHKHFLNY
jgi:hypothetical protein